MTIALLSVEFKITDRARFEHREQSFNGCEVFGMLRVGFECLIGLEIANETLIPNIARGSGCALVGTDRPMEGTGHLSGECVQDFNNVVRISSRGDFPEEYMTDHMRAFPVSRQSFIKMSSIAAF